VEFKFGEPLLFKVLAIFYLRRKSEGGFNFPVSSLEPKNFWTRLLDHHLLSTFDAFIRIF